MSENLPEKRRSIREALESTGIPTIGSMGSSPNSQSDNPHSTLPSLEGREMIRKRLILEEEQQETVKVIEATNRHVAALYISANTELRKAAAEVIGENDKIESDKLKEVCDDFEEFMTDDLGVTLVEDTRWGKGRVQDIATRSLRPDTTQPRPDNTVPKEMTLRRKNTGGVLQRILGRGEEIWEVDR